MAPGQLGKPWRFIYQHYLPRNPIEAAIPGKARVLIWLCHRTQLWYRVATYAGLVLHVAAIGRDGNAVLVPRWVAVCINDCLAATGHALDKVVESAGWQRSPTFLHDLEQLVFVLLLASGAVVVLDTPKVLNGIDVWRLARPTKDFERAIGFLGGQIALDDVGRVFRIVILLKNETPAQDTFARWNSVLDQNLLVFLFHENATHTDKRTNATSSEACPHHNSSVLFYGANNAISVVSFV